SINAPHRSVSGDTASLPKVMVSSIFDPDPEICSKAGLWIPSPMAVNHFRPESHSTRAPCKAAEGTESMVCADRQEFPKKRVRSGKRSFLVRMGSGPGRIQNPVVNAWTVVTPKGSETLREGASSP